MVKCITYVIILSNFHFLSLYLKIKKNNIILMIRNVAQRADFSRIPQSPPLFRRAFYIVQFDFLFFFFKKEMLVVFLMHLYISSCSSHQK